MSGRQLSLIKRERMEHGGHVRSRKRKEVRPFSPKCSIHVVMRSGRARGGWSLLHRKNRSTVEKLLYGWAKAKHVTVYKFVNVGNHLHLLLKAPSRQALQQFLKTFAGLCARAVTGAQKGLKLTGRFWDATAYSRLVPGGAFKAIWSYLNKNELEAVGFRGITLRRRTNGEYLIVHGDPPPGTEAQCEALIRGSPARA